MSALPVRPPSYLPRQVAPLAQRQRELAQQQRELAQQQREPWLRIVKPPEQSRTRLPFVLSCISVLAASLLGTLFLNTSLAADVYTVQGLQTEYATLLQTEQSLTGQVQEASSPLELAAAAANLGMIPTESPSFLRLADGAVLGAVTED
jgi:hypothetical protein